MDAENAALGYIARAVGVKPHGLTPEKRLNDVTSRSGLRFRSQACGPGGVRRGAGKAVRLEALGSPTDNATGFAFRRASQIGA